MVYLWQHNLPDILRADPVLAPKVIEWPGWRDRGRPPENFSFAPSGHISHHTGCAVRFNSHDPTGCINFIIAGNSATGVPGPISQYLGTVVKPGTRYDGTNLDPHIVIIAAGRANHAGGGKYNWGAPEGNGSSIAGEWCGPFDRWPDEYIEFRRRCLAAILRGNKWPIDRDMTHQEYASFDDGRKIDPSGGWIGEPTLGLTTPWNPNLWRGYVNELLQPPDPPDPPPPSDLLLMGGEPVFICKDATTTFWIGNGFTRRRLRNDGEVDRWVARRLRGFVGGRIVDDRNDVPTVLPRALVDLGVDVSDQVIPTREPG